MIITDILVTVALVNSALRSRLQLDPAGASRVSLALLSLRLGVRRILGN